MNADPRFGRITLRWIECLEFKASRVFFFPMDPWFIFFSPVSIVGGHVGQENIKSMALSKVHEPIISLSDVY